MGAYVGNLPRTVLSNAEGIRMGEVVVPLAPAVVPVGGAESSAVTIAAGPLEYVLAGSGAKFFSVVAGDGYDLAIRFRAAGDSAGITARGGASPYHEYVRKGSKEQFAVPEWAASVVIGKVTTGADLVVIEK
jgi:hypothetical protein